MIPKSKTLEISKEELGVSEEKLNQSEKKLSAKDTSGFVKVGDEVDYDEKVILILYMYLICCVELNVVNIGKVTDEYDRCWMKLTEECLAKYCFQNVHASHDQGYVCPG